MANMLHVTASPLGSRGQSFLLKGSYIKITSSRPYWGFRSRMACSASAVVCLLTLAAAHVGAKCVSKAAEIQGYLSKHVLLAGGAAAASGCCS